jgi:glycogen(starch) synthase
VRDDSGNVDGLPNVVMESLASGTPLVTTTAGGIGAVARDGVNAAVVAERDAAGLAERIDALLRQPERRAAMGAEARARVVREHGWDVVARAMERAYRLARVGNPTVPTR